jgi:hypothetical protein
VRKRMDGQQQGYAAATAVQHTFGRLVEDLFATFCEELSVAESIDMFHLTSQDWDQKHIAVFTVSYVGFIYKHWLFGETSFEAIEGAMILEAERVLSSLRRHENGESNSHLSVASRIDQLSKEWLAYCKPGTANTPFSRTPEAILFVCRHLLKPESQAKAENLAQMPFLQIYIPERVSRARQLTETRIAPRA